MFRFPTFVKLVITLFVCFSLLLSGCQKRKPPLLVCLFFDDAWENQYDAALPILLEFDFKATFGVITNNIGTGQGFWKYMDESKLKELASYGMDIACHTKTHADLTANLTHEQMQQEIVDSKKQLEGLGFKIRTFVYPYCEWNNKAIGYVEEAGYISARSCGGIPQTYYPITNDTKAKYHVPTYPITDQSFWRFQRIVNHASKDSVVCLTYHFISDTGPQQTSTPVQNFYEQMRYLKENGFKVVILSDLVEVAKGKLTTR